MWSPVLTVMGGREMGGGETGWKGRRAWRKSERREEEVAWNTFLL